MLFDSDSDNSIVYEDISLLFYNVVTLAGGAAIISRRLRTHPLFYVMIYHLHGKCRYEKISCYFTSCTVVFEKCKNLLYMNEDGTECKTNIFAYGFWPNKPIIWYFIHECLNLSMKSMHAVKLLTWGMWHNIHVSVCSAIFQIWRESKYWSLKMCDCLYVTVNTQVQQYYVTVYSLLRYCSHTHFLAGPVRENKIGSELSNTPAIFATV